MALIGVKGRIQTSSYEDQEGNKKYSTEVIAEKVTFLSSKPKEEKEDNDNSKKC